MLPYKTDVNSSQTWQTASILYTFSSSYNSSVFAGRLVIDENSITGDGDAVKWQAAIDAVKAVSFVPLAETTNPASAVLGLVSGTVNGSSTGLGYRDPSSTTANNITRGLGIIEGNQSSYLYIHELLHTLGLKHPGGGEGNDPAFAHYTIDSTVMRYASSNDTFVRNADGGYKKILTPMIYDIALLQQKYGAKIESVPEYIATGNNEARTLWLGGARGVEHINAKDVTAAPPKIGDDFYNKIDLRGGFETVDGKLLPRFSQVGNEVFSLALDSANNWEQPIVVENATGSLLAPNMLIGNAANNILIGGNKRDTIIGGGGESNGELLKGNDDKDIIVADKGYAKQKFGITFDVDATLPVINKSSLYGGQDTDLLVAGGDESRLYGGTEQDIYAVASGAFIEDGTGEDYATLAGIRLPGAVKQSWSESAYVYYQGLSGALVGSPGPTANLFSALSTLIEIPLATTARYAATVSGQLIIDFGLGRAGQAIVQDYDYLEGTAGITVFQQVTGESTMAQYTQYVKLALKATNDNNRLIFCKKIFDAA